MRRNWFVLAVLAACVLPAAGEDKDKSKDDQKRLADIFSALKAKRENAPRQSYKLAVNVIPAEGKPLEEEWELDIHWKSGRFRVHSWVSWTNQYETRRTFDGERFYWQARALTGERKPVGDGAWKYGVVTGRVGEGESFDHNTLRLVYFNQGSLLHRDDAFYPGHHSFAPDESKFAFAGEVMWQGRECVSITTALPNEPFWDEHEYILDPKRDYAVVGVWYYRNRKPTSLIEIALSPKKHSGHWLLEGWTIKTWGEKAELLSTAYVGCTHQVYADQTPPKEHFDIVPPEGATVSRSHFELKKDRQDIQWDRYSYRVTNGKLVQISGPKEGELWFKRHAGEFAHIVARAARR